MLVSESAVAGIAGYKGSLFEPGFSSSASSAPIRGLGNSAGSRSAVVSSLSLLPLYRAQWGVLLPLLPGSAISVLAQIYGQEDDKDGDHEHH